jgi:hypothetical protein
VKITIDTQEIKGFCFQISLGNTSVEVSLFPDIEIRLLTFCITTDNLGILMSYRTCLRHEGSLFATYVARCVFLNCPVFVQTWGASYNPLEPSCNFSESDEGNITVENVKALFVLQR